MGGLLRRSRTASERRSPPGSKPLPRPDVDTLLARVYSHCPRGLESDDPRHSETEESRRLMCVQEAAARSCGWPPNEVPAMERVPTEPAVESVVMALRAWRSFAERWNEEMPDIHLIDESNPWHDASYRYSALRPGYVLALDRPPEQQGKPDIELPGGWADPVVLSLSILAPVYVIYTYIVPPERPEDADMEFRYRDFPRRYRDRVAALHRLSEEIFGFHRLDEATLLTPVPDVAPPGGLRMVDEANLRDCLFTVCP